MELKTIEEHLEGHPPQPPEPIVAGLLFRKTMAVLGAPDDSFKTNWAIQLAVSVASGIPFLSYSCRKSRVVYVVLEGGQDYILERFEEKINAMGVDKAKVMRNVYVKDCTEYQLDDKDDVKRLESAIDEVSPSPDLVILDPITYALNEDVRFSPAKTILVRRLLLDAELWDNVALLVVHCRKDASDNNSMDDYLGSGVLARAAATRIKLYRTDNTTVNMYSKTRHAERPDELQLHMQYPLLIVGGHILRPRRESELLALEILEANNGEMGLSKLIQEIRQQKNCNEKTARAALNNLELEGKVTVERLPKSAKKVVRLPASDVVQAS